MRFVREQSQQSVVQVLDPQVYLRKVKRDLSDKSGLPAEHQRLTFAVAAAVERTVAAPPLQASPESLLCELHTWQALVYLNKKCLGRFVKPRLYTVTQPDNSSCASKTDACSVQQLSIAYDSFQPASLSAPAHIHIPVVSASSSDHYHFTIVGHCEQHNFVLPATYQFTGQQAAYGLQRALYTAKHQQSHSGAAGSVAALSPLINPGDLSLAFGTGVAQFSAVFEPQADSAWLKCLILKFYLVAQSSLHEGSPPLSEAESSASYTSGRTHHTLSSTQQQQSIDPAASGTMLPKNKSVNKNRKQKQTSRAPGGARTATDSFQSSPRVPAPQLRQSAGGSQQHNKTKQPSAHSDSTMAVPVASDDSKAVNGFSARAVVDADSSGSPADGLTQTEGSSIVGSSEDAASSWHAAAAQRPSVLNGPDPIVTASDDATELQSLISDTISQIQPDSARASARSSQADLMLHNGWQDDASANGQAASHTSVKSAPHMPAYDPLFLKGPAVSQARHGGAQGSGLYAEPGAVHAWATDGAASASIGSDADAPQLQPPRQAHCSSLPPSSAHTNGYAPGSSQASLAQVQPGRLYPHLFHSGDAPGRNHWQDAFASPAPLPAGLGQQPSHSPGSVGWAGADMPPAAQLSASARDQLQAGSRNLPGYAAPAYHKQPHVYGFPGHAQHWHQGAAAPSSRLTSSLQSLDLAHDGWHSLRPGQEQRASRGRRPASRGTATQPPSARVSPERPREAYSDTGRHPHAAPSLPRPAGHRGQKQPAYMQPSAFLAAQLRSGGFPEAAHVPPAQHYDSRQGQGSWSVGVGRALGSASVGPLPGGYQEPQNLLPEGQIPAPLDIRDQAAATDLERLVQQLTPTLPSQEQSMQQLTLGDLWQWYLEPSLYGTEVLTLGGSRGPSVSYYVPYLSAMQLLVPVQSPAAHAQQQPSVLKQTKADVPAAGQQQPAAVQHQGAWPQQGVQSGQEDLQTEQQPEGGQTQASEGVGRLPKSGKVYQVQGNWQDGQGLVQPLIEHFDTELPFNRVALHDKVQEMAAGKLCSGLPGALLNSQLLHELHPASWYSVAWYPAYRIPDAPLNGRFLTFHHLTPLPGPLSSPSAATIHGMRDSSTANLQETSNESRANAYGRNLHLPVAGLKFCNLHGERWLEPLTMESAADLQAAASGSQVRSNRGSISVSYQSQQHVNGLQHHAEYLARGHGLRVISKTGLDSLQQRHPDFEFFHTRH